MEAGSGQSRAPAPFLRKTWDLVEDAQSEHIVRWTAEGASFVVLRPAELASDILPKYFKHNNFSSFVRQLNTYGFRKVDPDRWEFSNECFMRGRRDLLGTIIRRKPAGAAGGGVSNRNSGGGADGDNAMAELDLQPSDVPQQQHGQQQQQQQQQHQHQQQHQQLQQQHQQQQWGGPPSGFTSPRDYGQPRDYGHPRDYSQPAGGGGGFISPRGEYGQQGNGGYVMDRLGSGGVPGSGMQEPPLRIPSYEQQEPARRSAFRPPGAVAHLRGGSNEPSTLPAQGSGGSNQTNVGMPTPFAFNSGPQQQQQQQAQPMHFGGQLPPQQQGDDKSQLQRLADHASSLRNRSVGSDGRDLSRRSDHEPRFNTAVRQGSADSGGSTQPSGGDTPGGGNTHNTATTGNTSGSGPATGGSSGSGGGHMDPEEQGGAKKRKFRGVRQGVLPPDMAGAGSGSDGFNSNRSGGTNDVSRPVPLNLADMAAQLQRMSQLAIDVENLKMRNALLETELLRARQTDWQDRATMEARMSANEDFRAQAEARNRLEDTWKAGQEAAMFRWRAEQHAMQQGEMAWKSMNDQRYADMMRTNAARNTAEDAWKAQSEARLKAGEDRQIASETREAIREQERRSGSNSKERSTSQDLSGGGVGRLPNLSGGHTNSNGPTASNDTANSGGQSGGAGAMATPAGAPGGAAINSGGSGAGTGGTGGTVGNRSGASSDEAERMAQLQRLMDQGAAMEKRLAASEAASALQVQQAREIAARFNEQSAKNQYDTHRDHAIEQRLILQEQHASHQAQANNRLQEQIAELTRQLQFEREARVDHERRSGSRDGTPSHSHGQSHDRPAVEGSAQSGSVASGTDHGNARSEAQSARGGSGSGASGLPPRPGHLRQSPQHSPQQSPLQQQSPRQLQSFRPRTAESEPQASRMSLDETGAEALQGGEEVEQLRMASATFSSNPAARAASGGGTPR